MSFVYGLKKIGFSDKKASIYLSLITHGEMTVKELVDKTKLIRTTIYEIMESLQKDGLVSVKTNNDKKKVFFAEDPSRLSELVESQAKKINDQKQLLDSQQKEIQELVPQLKSLSNNIIGKPKFNFYEGAKGLVEALNDVLVNKSSVQIIGSTDGWKRWMPDHYEWYFNELKKRKIDVKQIEQKSIQDLRKNKDEGAEEWPKKYLPVGFTLPGFSIIYGDKILLASFQKPMATILHEKEYAQSQKSMYELFWQFIKN